MFLARNSPLDKMERCNESSGDRQGRLTALAETSLVQGNERTKAVCAVFSSTGEQCKLRTKRSKRRSRWLGRRSC